MRGVIQRVAQAKVVIDKETVAGIERGIVVLVGIEEGNTHQDADWLADKLIDLRIFDDEEGKLNLSLMDIGGEILVVSQFTLLGDCRKGRRPSFDKAASPHEAEKLYQYFVERLKSSGLKVETGRFRMIQQIHLINDGPVTLLLDSRKPF